MFHHLRGLSVVTGAAVGAIVGASSATTIFIATASWLSEGFNEQECSTRHKLDLPFRTADKERRGLVAEKPDPLKVRSHYEEELMNICERLQMEGIQIKEKNEAEARRALAEYALFRLHDGIKRHSEKKCEEKCGLGVSDSAHNRRPDALPSFFDSPPILSAQ